MRGPRGKSPYTIARPGGSQESGNQEPAIPAILLEWTARFQRWAGADLLAESGNRSKNGEAVAHGGDSQQLTAAKLDQRKLDRNRVRANLERLPRGTGSEHLCVTLKTPEPKNGPDSN